MNLPNTFEPYDDNTQPAMTVAHYSETATRVPQNPLFRRPMTLTEITGPKRLATKLKPNGVGFVHHSNLGAYQQAFAAIAQIPTELSAGIVDPLLLEPTHWRAASMTAKLFETYCDRANLKCIGQELVNWGNQGLLIDSFSMFTPKNSTWTRDNQVIENLAFMTEAASISKLSQLYSTKRK